jgi:diguanylate cyclase (GGDEF)-like protein
MSSRGSKVLAFIAPGGLILLAIIALLGWAPIPSSRYPTAQFAFYAAIFAGLLFTWRFRSLRVFSVLLVLLLMEVSPAGPGPLPASARVTFGLVAVLLPLNYLLFSLLPDHGFSLDGLAFRAAILLADFVAVGISGRESSSVRNLAVGPPWPAFLIFALAAGVLLFRFFKYAKPVESGFFWSLIAVWLALRSGGSGVVATAYMATAALILCSSIIDTWYFLAYHDELTSLPSRRAFNDALLNLRGDYSIAVADVDHFKAFNDLYGHDTGDEVLRMVASHLAGAGGGAQAFRVGGEEFALLFREKTAAETIVHLEALRARIANFGFIVRGHDRRKEPRGPERRQENADKKKQRMAGRELLTGSVTSVTVSMGVASCEEGMSDPSHVIAAADKALYRAKKAGRNCIEVAGAAPPRRKRARQVAYPGA